MWRGASVIVRTPVLVKVTVYVYYNFDYFLSIFFHTLSHDYSRWFKSLGSRAVRMSYSVVLAYRQWFSLVIVAYASDRIDWTWHYRKSSSLLFSAIKREGYYLVHRPASINVSVVIYCLSYQHSMHYGVRFFFLPKLTAVVLIGAKPRPLTLSL